MTKYWRSLEELNDPVAFKKSEIRLEVDAKRAVTQKAAGSSRRDFLKTFGFSVAAAAVVASCKRPVDKAIPYLVKPEEVTPGVANYYASSYFEGNEYCSVLVKVRDGRPIKIEGNDLSSVSKRGTSARVQASVLNLYDDARFKTPLKRGEATTWEAVDDYITKKLAQLNQDNKKVVLLTSSIISPSTQKVIQQFQERYPVVEWLPYDAVSATGILKANELSFGSAFIPDYRFEKAKVVVGFGADFLGTWLSSVEYIKGYSAGRRVLEKGDEMNRHYQFETGMTVTGSNADVRFPIKPSEEKTILTALYYQLLQAKGSMTVTAPASPVDINGLAEDLLANEGHSLVVSGSNDVNTQLIVNAINQLLGNYGNTVLTSTTLNTHQGIDADFETFISELKNKTVAGVLCWGVNPVYNHPKGSELKDLIAGAELSVSFSDRKDETTAACHWVCPEPHYLESWNDAEPKSGMYSLAQPTISKLFDSRQVQETLLKWAGEETPNYYEYVKKYWSEELFKLQNTYTDTRIFWNEALQKGVFEPEKASGQLTYSEAGLGEALSAQSESKGWEVVLYESVGLKDGSSGNNPWLQELPDPVAKISWDNFAAVPVKWAEENGLQNESVITINGVELPVFIQPGQAAGTISVALGYGREIAGKVGDGVGTNMYPFVSVENGARKFWVAGADVQTTAKTFELALSQTHHSMEGRPIVRETNFSEWQIDPRSGNELKEEHEKHDVSLYPAPEFKGHHWGMAVDLSSCIGCSNCAISCQAENNVQVIGKEQVRNRRIMHWIRIDRYFSNNPENPEVYHQPVMCQHCDNAPCENVCPVSATPHSDEGLNQMAYNRCVGTKYCVNNCPYKVRRFNWFEYVKNDAFDFNSNSDLGRMVLNPDVTVRSRGVVEKCSFCVQRIQEKKTAARVAGRKVEDGEIQPACVQSCPADALVFGDLNDPNSKISKYFKNERNYHLLEELHTLPSVGYLTKVRNKKS
ncbi:TAT-variant-translocated molybdopterin oxidoreductase [Maribellus sp. YY47]|uniref:TAT-variant-translocated molybdopterin oxidoreductase n=1 Tax=Maribellus sp. YY47 TaxID=2929486 RepID=UPI0020010D0D|nr:TAT-variant-translocated molybdopterin oxidoreductase [Maribellus sp. YY47]MCK3682655.1 TAT-variant-translocated molybdopterin oxidoreductase [Maribellus sp. YY47]